MIASHIVRQMLDRGRPMMTYEKQGGRIQGKGKEHDDAGVLVVLLRFQQAIDNDAL